MSPGSAPGGPSHGGRPRDPHLDRAILEATLGKLDESGYGALTLEHIARQAGTTKPAIYRRWPNRQRLVLAALALRLDVPEAPDSGCTLCDLYEGILVFVEAFNKIRPDVIGPLLADCTADPELHRAFMATLFDPPRVAVGNMLRKAVARGDLRADIDHELLLDMLGSLVHYRALFGHAAIGEEEVDRALEALLGGVANDYPALVAHSLEMDVQHEHAAAESHAPGQH
ncbi:transcriptional regulator [Prauserella marina]|uniref:DNA-binding transcriptional regulator, AcrR family n=1 Tax=Prauserella marina TaxID=530584 RepID=A0A222VXZ7_9PSEU|nr:TetR/AcrR family transcriptional regulator [Prauserella marina]ASR38553.1 transcriptional regulator [Prauserella marina]PWV81863.1 TetR family transcriptional regulator [Prauserella marina]SDD14089.1 DNA-binding transcriptional regulator, AcrR family [Prauserella marina]